MARWFQFIPHVLVVQKLSGKGTGVNVKYTLQQRIVLLANLE